MRSNGKAKGLPEAMPPTLDGVRDGTMRVPVCVDRPFRRFLKRLPTARTSVRRLRYFVLLPLVLLLLLPLHLRRASTLSLSRPTRTSMPGTTVLTPCDPTPCNTRLTPSQTLNLLAALALTEYLLLHTTCNATGPALPPTAHSFYTTSSSVLLPRSTFLSTGFDERFTTPGIPSLAALLPLHHVALTPPRTDHLARTYLPLARWRASDASVYTVTTRAPLSLTLLSSPSPHSSPASALATARRRALHDVHNLPFQLLALLPADALPRLAAELDAGKPLLVVHVAHGLGNRLRALASSLAFAAATNRSPILVWPTDAHCAAPYHRLFEPSFPVIPHFPGFPFRRARFYDHAFRQWDVYNYMPGEGGLKDAVIRDSSRHIYYKSAYVMRSPHTSWDAANAHLRALTPVHAVRQKVDAASARLRRSIGVHIRHLSTADDIGGVDPVGEYGDFDTRVIGYFRSACSPRAFIDQLHVLKATTGYADVFVASDSPLWRRQIAEHVSGVWGMPDCQGRCEEAAMVDLLALAQCPEVLGSFWSSFSEAVQRFSGRKIQLAGVDFGHPGRGFGEDVEEFAREIVRKRRAAGK